MLKDQLALKDQKVELLPSRTTMRARTLNVQVNFIYAPYSNIAVVNGGHNWFYFG